MDKRVKVTESLFIAVKSLLNAGATHGEIKKYYGISTGLCTWIKQAENYEEYKHILAAAAMKKKEQYHAKKDAPVAPAKTPEVTEQPVAQVVEHRQSVTIQATHFMMQELQKTNELLTGISAKLAYIVEQLS